MLELAFVSASAHSLTLCPSASWNSRFSKWSSQKPLPDQTDTITLQESTSLLALLFAFFQSTSHSLIYQRLTLLCPSPTPAWAKGLTFYLPLHPPFAKLTTVQTNLFTQQRIPDCTPCQTLFWVPVMPLFAFIETKIPSLWWFCLALGRGKRQWASQKSTVCSGCACGVYMYIYLDVQKIKSVASSLPSLHGKQMGKKGKQW